jgi:hypothetical protein
MPKNGEAALWPSLDRNLGLHVHSASVRDRHNWAVDEQHRRSNLLCLKGSF